MATTRVKATAIRIPTTKVETARDTTASVYRTAATAAAAAAIARPKVPVSSKEGATTSRPKQVPASTVEAAHDAAAMVYRKAITPAHKAATEAAAEYRRPDPVHAAVTPAKRPIVIPNDSDREGGGGSTTPAYMPGPSADREYTTAPAYAPSGTADREYTPEPAYVETPDAGGYGGGGQSSGYASQDSGGSSSNQGPATDYVDDWKAPQSPQASTSTALVPVSKNVPVISPSDKPGLFVRIWRFFFGGPKGTPKSTAPAVMHGDPSNSQEAATVSLVRRARAGDQNAMATLNLIRENAAKGETKAVAMYRMLCAHVRANPIAAIHGKSSGDVRSYAAAVRLSHGEPLSNSRIREYTATMSADEQNAFVAGMYQRPVFGSDPSLHHANFMGRSVAIARRLQDVRSPLSPISNYDHACAWELGE